MKISKILTVWTPESKLSFLRDWLLLQEIKFIVQNSWDVMSLIGQFCVLFMSSFLEWICVFLSQHCIQRIFIIWSTHWDYPWWLGVVPINKWVIDLYGILEKFTKLFLRQIFYLETDVIILNFSRPLTST